MGSELTVILAVSVAACLAAAVSAVLALRARADAKRRDAALRGIEDGLSRALAALDGMVRATEQVAGGVAEAGRRAAGAEAVGQERFDAAAREFHRLGAQNDALRRETAAQLDKVRETVDVRLGEMRVSTDRQLEAVRADNERQLERMRATVDEKLAQTLNDRLGASFKQVSDQLEAVYRGLGDMRSVASGVGDLKRVLGNVKTRGILGEVQLAAILADILAPDQYLENVATKPGAAERVEFAVKLPVAEGDPVLLPIDAKFPGDTYEHLRDAVDAGDAEAAAAARRALDQVVRAEARDIAEKYISVPETTNFAIMFLPFEGLYAEVVDTPGLVAALQRDYQVNVAGPSTMAAMLNSLQMSYQTFAFQRQADEIQKVLAAVKAEFPKYQNELRRALKQIETAGRTVDGIINTRTNVIERKLRSVTAMEDDAEAASTLGLEPPGDGEAVGYEDEEA